MLFPKNNLLELLPTVGSSKWKMTLLIILLPIRQIMICVSMQFSIIHRVPLTMRIKVSGRMKANREEEIQLCQNL